MHAKTKLILTGTPIENSLSELYNLFHFVQPGVLGDKLFFETQFCKQIIKGGYSSATPVEKHTAKKMVRKLRTILKQHLLRRTK